jgi:hypothetical protein
VSLTYEVTATMPPQLLEQWLAWMHHEHAARVIATGCFTAALVERESATQARVRYLAPDRGSIERYLAAHAPRLREEGARRFPTGIAYRRAIWESVGEARAGGDPVPS